MFVFLPIAPEERSMTACTAGCGAMVCVWVTGAEEKFLFLNYLEGIKNNYMCGMSIITIYLQT